MAATYLPSAWWFACLLVCLLVYSLLSGVLSSSDCIASNVLTIVTKELEVAATCLNMTSDICPSTCQSVPSVFEPDYCQVQVSAAAQIALA